jgi:hypothetical protein
MNGCFNLVSLSLSLSCQPVSLHYCIGEKRPLVANIFDKKDLYSLFFIMGPSTWTDYTIHMNISLHNRLILDMLALAYPKLYVA